MRRTKQRNVKRYIIISRTLRSKHQKEEKIIVKNVKNINFGWNSVITADIIAVTRFKDQTLMGTPKDSIRLVKGQSLF